MRKVFLDDLPRWENGIGSGTGNGGTINWSKSINYKVKGIYNDLKFEVKIINYEFKKQKLTIEYNNKNFKIGTDSFKKCQFGKILGITTTDFKIEIGQIFKDNKRDLNIIDRKYKKNKTGINQKYYKCHCNKCGYEGWILEASILNGTGCSVCCFSPRIVVEGINDIPTTAPWMVQYFQNPNEAKLYTKSCSHKIYPICPDCGRVKDKPIKINTLYGTHSIFCSCSDNISYPQKIMYSLLEQLQIKFEMEYTPSWIKPKRYDFYFELNDKEYIVEMDGGWHFYNNKISGQTVKKSKEIDNYKDKLAKEHNIQVIRIDCSESDLSYIKNNIINSKLINIFNLYKVDWLKCEEFALSSLVKKVCNIKKDNPDLSATQIGKIIKLNRTTIRGYLKKGTLLGWINYNPKEEKNRVTSKNGKKGNIPVGVYKNNILLGEFKSAREAVREFEKIFDAKLSYSSISNVCNGKLAEHRGFTFKFLDEKILDNIIINKEKIEKELELQKIIKPIKMYKNKIFLGMFSSPKELEKLSNKLFNVKLSNAHIYSVCKKERKHHQGFTFEFASKEEYLQYMKDKEEIKNKEDINNATNTDLIKVS